MDQSDSSTSHDAVFETLPIDDEGESGEVVFDFDAPDGAPDLFVWHPEPARDMWFFAEVKGPRDALRDSQFE
ncbi:MAG: VRR-NUC domain-containing protein [Sandaracinaceae bacterium]|nr:VRR-NUC domain-containing protein [Sandaracinaceae bacterium]